MVKLSESDLVELADVAIAAATQAGLMIAGERPRQVDHKVGGASLASQVVTEVDRRSEAMILDVLAPSLQRYGLALLTEEREDDGGRLVADHFWCIDPLDGTLPFIEGSAGYAVSIALVTRGGSPLIGVVYDPVEAALFHAISGIGAFGNGSVWPSSPEARTDVLSVFADRSFLALDDHDDLVESLTQIALEMGLAGLRLRPTAGAVMNACGVLREGPACYFKFPKPRGGGSLWDFAATACLFREAGAVVTDIHGDPLDLNRTDSTFMNHRGVVFATDDTLAGKVRALYPRTREIGTGEMFGPKIH